MNRPTIRTLARLLAPWRTIRRLEATVQRLEKILENPLVAGIEIGSKTASVTAGFQGSGPQLLAGMFVGLLQEHPDAVNYLQLTFGSLEGPILVTVQRPGGTSPHGLRAQAEQRVRQLEAELLQLQGGASGERPLRPDQGPGAAGDAPATKGPQAKGGFHA